MEDEPVRTGLCARCCLADDLFVILDGGSGSVAEHMMPLHESLTSQQHARSARIWLTVNPETTKLLSDLSTGRAPMEHDTFTDHTVAAKVKHLRKLLTNLGMLVQYDRLIEGYEDWLTLKLEGIQELRDRQLITQYARFVHLDRMRHLASKGELKTGTLLSARQSTTMAIEFLSFLRTMGRPPHECLQADVDSWLTSGPTTRSLARTFVRWAISSNHMPKLNFPYRVAKTLPRIAQEERLELLRRAIDDPSISPHDRVAMTLLLVFGQPLTRAVAMKMSQVIDAPNEPLRLAFTREPVEVPEPFGALFRIHMAARPNMNTAANAQSNWLFPGMNPGEHASAQSVMIRLRGLGVDLRGAKNTTMQELVLQMPPALVAEALGYSYQVMDIHESNAGGRWKNYPTLRGSER